LTVGLVVLMTLVASEALAVATVLPLVAHDLHGVGLYGWVVSAFFLATLVGVVVGGEQVDGRGPAPVFAVALAVFSAGLLASGMAQAMWMLIVGRALQGLGAGALSPTTFAAIGRAIPEGLRPRVFALLSSAWFLGPAWRPLVRLLPAGTVTARRGLPVTVLVRGLLAFGFFGVDAFVPLEVVSVRHGPVILGGAALTGSALSWTLGSWLHVHFAQVWSARRFVGTGLAIVVLGIAGVAAVLASWLPLGVAVAAWTVGGFGIGLAYSPLSVSTLRLAPQGGESTATAGLQLLDNLGVELGTLICGVAVAIGAAAGRLGIGIGIAYAIAAAVALLAIPLTRRLPRGPLVADPG
jgi:predicted MFS family arabinose efflux permease